MGILEWLSHIGMQLRPAMEWIWMPKFSCAVDVEVVGVKNLPVARMERFLLSVCVRDKLTGEVYTKPSRVTNGAAYFNETFFFKCHIPGTKDYIKYGGPPSITVSLVAINPGESLGLKAELGSAISEKITDMDVDCSNVTLHFAPGTFPEGGVLNLKLHYKRTSTNGWIFERLFQQIRPPFSVPAFSEQGVSSLEETNRGGKLKKKMVLQDMIAEEAPNLRAHIEVGLYRAWAYAKEFPRYDDVTIWGQLKPITRLGIQYEESDLVLKMDEHCIGLVLDNSNSENPKKDKEDYGIYINKTETEYSKHVSKYPGVSLRNTSTTFSVYINWKKVPKNKSVEVKHGDYISFLTPPLGKLAIGFVFRHVDSWQKEGLLDPLKELREEVAELKKKMSEICRSKTSSSSNGSEVQFV